MKKLFLGLGLVAGTFAFAQTSPTFGAKAGMNVSSLSTEEGLSDQGSKIGFYGGLFMNAPISEQFSIQPELIYSQYGDKYDFTNPINDEVYSSARHLDYLTLPVMFQYNATPSFYIEAGPEFGLLLSAKNKFKNESDNDVLDESGNYKDNLNNFNVGVGLGAGYYFTPNIGLTARYTAGLTDIYKSDRNDGDAVRNNVFQVGVAFKF